MGAFSFREDALPGLLSRLPTPCYVIDEGALLQNGRILKALADETGCKVLLAQKAFSNYDFYPLLSLFLSGTEASGLYEAHLGKEMFGGETHIFSAAYRDKDFDEICRYADHIVFNSVNQLKKFGFQAKSHGLSVGLRINPELSTQEGHGIYDPCAPGSRLGVTLEAFREMTEELVALLDGLHFHTLCEQDSDALELTLGEVEKRFGDILALPNIKWLNMGGGHHITRNGYDIERLKRLIRGASERWNVTVYLEPGEACALNAGYLAARVLDVVSNSGKSIAILDVSAACHTPDVIEMPYTPPVYSSSEPGMLPNNYRLAGPTCLAGDVFGDYSFAEPLKPGDLVIFGDMAIYSTCKNNTFNGMPLPDIWRLTEGGELSKLTNFSYGDFKYRLGSKQL